MRQELNRDCSGVRLTLCDIHFNSVSSQKQKAISLYWYWLPHSLSLRIKSHLILFCGDNKMCPVRFRIRSPVAFANVNMHAKVWHFKLGAMLFFMSHVKQVYHVDAAKGPSTLADYADAIETNIALTGKIDLQPILSVTVPVKKIKGAFHQCYVDSNGVAQCEQSLKVTLMQDKCYLWTRL